MAFARSGLCRIGGSGTGGSTWQYTSTDAKTVVDSFVESGDISADSCNDKICKVSVVGVGMKSHSGVAARAFSTMAGENININMISTSEIKISVLIDRKYVELAVQALHDAFELEKLG